MGIEIVLSGSHVCREYHSRCSVCASSGEARERVIERRVKTATGGQLRQDLVRTARLRSVADGCGKAGESLDVCFARVL